MISYFVLLFLIECLFDPAIKLFDLIFRTILFCSNFSTLFSDGSVEQHRYTGSLTKEKKAFESLIDTKEHMVISLPDHTEDLIRYSSQP